MPATKEASLCRDFDVEEIDGSLENEAALLTALHLLTFDRDDHVPNWKRSFNFVVSRVRTARPRHYAGFASFVDADRYGLETYAYLNRIGVLEAYRGRGLSMRLIRAAERRARVMGFTTMVSDTTHNPASANNFIKAGYRTFLPEFRWGFAASVYWIKQL
jgi:GNAT superfamily N-acetyltransferase